MGLLTKFNTNSYLIVDTSYLIHTIAFRSMRIYSEHFDLPEDLKEVWKIDFSLDEDFCSIFDRNFVGVIKRFIQRNRIPMGRVIFAIDCKKTDIWRRSYFPEYKLRRIAGPEEPEGLNRGPLFEHAKNTLLPRLIDKGIGVIISHPLAEGDDVIAVSHKVIRETDPNVNIIIMAHDFDFLQLCDDNTEVITVQEKRLKDSSTGSRTKDLLKKILLGDGSDEIPKCFNKTKGDKHLWRGFGEATCMQFIDNPELMKAKFKEYPEAARQFKINKQIIDFRMIPESITESIAKDVIRELDL